MAATLTFNSQFDPQTGVAVPIAAGLVRITAPNASAYTFTGTNSFLLGHERLALLDPGPDDPAHLAALHSAMAGRRLEAIILTHTHRDHSAAAARLARSYDVPVWFGGRHRLSRPLRRFERNVLRRSCDWDLVPDRTLVDGETIAAGDLAISVHTTPGHCANHLAFAIKRTDMVLVGDHVMGWNSTVVAAPDGSLDDYLASLDKIIALPQTRYVSAHGGEIADGPAFARALKAHRLMRNGQLLEVLRAGPTTLAAATRAIYPTLKGRLALGARRTLLSHAEYLEARGEIEIRRGLLSTRLFLRD